MARANTPLGDSLLRAIAEHPTDDTPRLVYADWLDEREDPRAACLRAEVAAREVLGPQSVHGVLDAERHFEVAYAPQQLSALAALPFSRETLRACRSTHLLVAGAPLSLLDLRDRHPALFFSKRPAWYDRDAERAWTAAPVAPRWHLLRREPVPGSLGETFEEQQALLAEVEEVARAGEVVHAVILHYLAAGERLLLDAYVRCSDHDSGGYRVSVGGFDGDGLGVSDFWDDSRFDFVGLAASRKFSPLHPGSLAASGPLEPSAFHTLGALAL